MLLTIATTATISVIATANLFNIIFEKSRSNFLALIVFEKIGGFLLYSSKIELYQVELIFVGVFFTLYAISPYGDPGLV